MQEYAEQLAKKQREISVSEFFAKNRHLLGFDNPARALLMTVKEAVDNSLDATSEINVLPEILVEIIQLQENRFRVSVEDNGPGIVKKQIPNIFAKLLYGSKFHTLRQQRGQQGIGISASVLYSQLTTGNPTKILSKISKNSPAHYFELSIDTKNNTPKIEKEHVMDWQKDHGTRIELELEAKYLKGKQSVDEYIKQTAIVNPHTTIKFKSPEGTIIEYIRITDKIPKEAYEIKPHPHGIEFGNFLKMLNDTTSNTVSGFLQNDFSRIGPKTAHDIFSNSKISQKYNPRKLSRADAERLFKVLQETKISSPPSDCLSPITANLLEQGLMKEFNADFYVTTTRPTAVYRGMPFLIEVGIAYGGDIDKENAVRLLRFANRVPLLYQQGACAITEAVQDINWKPYGLTQSINSVPSGPIVLVVHIASVWVPFTSEAKEAIAHYPEIIKEIKLALQECGRKLAIYINKSRRAQLELQKKSYIEKYIPHIGIALKDILGLSDNEETKVVSVLKDTLEKSRLEK